VNINSTAGTALCRDRKARDGTREGVIMKKNRVMVLGMAAGMILSSCATTYREKMYADVIGFNDSVMLSYMPPPSNPKPSDMVKPIPGVIREKGDGFGLFVKTGNPYDLLLPSQAEAMKKAISKVPLGQNTAALYALDVGLDRVISINKNKTLMEGDPNSRYYVVFFTDGIDNASVSMAQRTRRGNYPQGIAGRDAYGVAMHARMESILKTYGFFGLVKKPNATNSFQSYVLLFQGQDLESYAEEQLAGIINPFRAAQNSGDAPALIMDSSMEGLREKFRDSFVVPSFSFQVPKDYVGQKVRMELGKDGEGEPVWFEATVQYERRPIPVLAFIKKDFYTLENITTSPGFSFLENTKQIRIEMDKTSYDKNANTVPFIISELKMANPENPSGSESFHVERESVTQWHDEGAGEAKFENTEYQKEGGGKKNAYILLVMDMSQSLGDNAEAARETAAWIVDYIATQM
jgi:hypothetical protein